MISYYAYPGVKERIHIPAKMTDKVREQYAHQIIETVAKFYGLTMEQINGKSREGDIPKACQISSYFIRERMPILTFKRIASFYGSRYELKSSLKFDHSAIIHNINSVKGRLKVKDSSMDDVNILKDII